MTRKEFMQITCDCIAEGRKRNFPNLRPSEVAASRFSDQKKALKVWRQSRTHFANMLPGVYLAQLRAAESRTKESTK